MCRESSHYDPLDPRWDKVCALLPVVQEWLSVVSDLVLEHKCAIPSAETNFECRVQENLDDATQDNDGTVAFATAAGDLAYRPVETLPIDVDERIRLRSVYEQYEACQDELSHGQWKAVCLRYRDGLSQAEIATRLGRSRSTVHGLLNRAHRCKEAYRTRMREAEFRVARKFLNKSE